MTLVRKKMLALKFLHTVHRNVYDNVPPPTTGGDIVLKSTACRPASAEGRTNHGGLNPTNRWQRSVSTSTRRVIVQLLILHWDVWNVLHGEKMDPFHTLQVPANDKARTTAILPTGVKARKFTKFWGTSYGRTSARSLELGFSTAITNTENRRHRHR